MLCECGEHLAYVLPRADAEPGWVYEYAFAPESEWVADWGDATVDGIAEIFSAGVENATAMADSFRGRRGFDPRRWRVRCYRCRREYRGVTAQLMRLESTARLAGRRTFTLSPDSLAEARPDIAGDVDLGT